MSIISPEKIDSRRILALNRRIIQRKRPFVVYWMQASQRTADSHALEYAIAEANSLHKPLLVFFCITDSFPEANLRHNRFMFEGLRETEDSLWNRGIHTIFRVGDPVEELVGLLHLAAAVVTDRGYLRIQRQWRRDLAGRLDCPLILVESDVLVPVETASGKAEYAAATIRKKIHRHAADFLQPVPVTAILTPSIGTDLQSEAISDIDGILSRLDIDKTVAAAPDFTGGGSAAMEKLDAFIARKLDGYAGKRNDPNEDAQSDLSPYLHFGQISPLRIAMEVQAAAPGSPDTEAFLEQLIVRRELSMNFVYYNHAYDSLDCLPDWARATLAKHAGDMREYRYTGVEFEHARTHDPYWNAAQNEMRITGKMHGYMRMYWGKKILEWSDSPEEAYATALFLNNKYELDGRDPNGFAGVAWCFGKHDRPWFERPVYGSVRYMNANGLKRKFDIERYRRRIEALSAHPEESV